MNKNIMKIDFNLNFFEGRFSRVHYIRYVTKDYKILKFGIDIGANKYFIFTNKAQGYMPVKTR